MRQNRQEFAERLNGRLVIDDTVANELSVADRNVAQFLEDFNIQRVTGATNSQTQEIMNVAGRTVANNDMRIVGTANARGLRLATSDRRQFGAALSNNIDVRIARFYDDRDTFFGRIRDTLSGRGIRNPAEQDTFLEHLNNF